MSDHISDQSSIIRFVEHNWHLGQIPGSFANIAGSLDDLFDFHHHHNVNPPLFIDPKTGQVTSTAPSTTPH